MKVKKVRLEKIYYERKGGELNGAIAYFNYIGSQSIKNNIEQI